MNLSPIERRIINILGASDKNFKVVTRDDLINKLREVRGSTFASVITVNEPSKMRKTNNPFVGNVFNLAQTQVQLNLDYQKKVNKNAEKEGLDPNFTGGESWHKRLTRDDGTMVPLSVNKNKDDGKIYLWAEKLSSKVNLIDTEGVDVDYAKIAPFIPPTKPYANQPGENKVEVYTPNVENIRAMTLQGETYLVTNVE